MGVGPLRLDQQHPPRTRPMNADPWQTLLLPPPLAVIEPKPRFWSRLFFWRKA